MSALLKQKSHLPITTLSLVGLWNFMLCHSNTWKLFNPLCRPGTIFSHWILLLIHTDQSSKGQSGPSGHSPGEGVMHIPCLQAVRKVDPGLTYWLCCKNWKSHTTRAFASTFQISSIYTSIYEAKMFQKEETIRLLISVLSRSFGYDDLLYAMCGQIRVPTSAVTWLPTNSMPNSSLFPNLIRTILSQWEEKKNYSWNLHVKLWVPRQVSFLHREDNYLSPKKLQHTVFRHEFQQKNQLFRPRNSPYARSPRAKGGACCWWDHKPGDLSTKHYTLPTPISK